MPKASLAVRRANCAAELRKLGWQEDRWGHYKHPQLPRHRIAMRKTKWRLEVHGHGWVRLVSELYGAANEAMRLASITNKLKLLERDASGKNS